MVAALLGLLLLAPAPDAEAVRAGVAAIDADAKVAFVAEQTHVIRWPDVTEETATRAVVGRRGGLTARFEIDWRDGKLRPLPNVADLPRPDLYDCPTVARFAWHDARDLLRAQWFWHGDGVGLETSITRSAASELRGSVADLFAGVDRGGERLLDLLMATPELDVGPNTQAINGGDCVVVSFDAPIGRVTLWLDPALAWQPRQATVERRAVDRFCPGRLWEAYDDRNATRRFAEADALPINVWSTAALAPGTSVGRLNEPIAADPDVWPGGDRALRDAADLQVALAEVGPAAAWEWRILALAGGGLGTVALIVSWIRCRGQRGSQERHSISRSTTG